MESGRTGRQAREQKRDREEPALTSKENGERDELVLACSFALVNTNTLVNTNINVEKTRIYR